MKQNVNIFISSAFRNMHVYRDMLIYEVRPIINQRLRESGYNNIYLNFIDLRWGIDEREVLGSLGMNAQILETCFKTLDESDIFIGLYTEYRGTIIPEDEIDLLNEQYHWNLPYNKSVTELEYWFCLNIKQGSTKFCKVFFEKSSDNINDISIVGDCITVKEKSKEKLIVTLCQHLTELIIEDITCSGGFPYTENEFVNTKITGTNIDSYLSEMMFATCSNDKTDEQSMVTNSTTISRAGIINEIIDKLFFSNEDFFTNDKKNNGLKLTLITGESGIGKSVLLSQLFATIRRQKLLTCTYLADASHISALDELLESSFDAYNIEHTEEVMTLAEKIRYLREHLDWFRIPCFIIDSIDDMSPEYFNQFLIELDQNFPNCYVITSTTRPYKDRYGTFLYKTVKLEAFNNEELEAAVIVHEKELLKKFPQKIRQELIKLENTEYAKPIVFKLILNDLSLLSIDDYHSILNSAEYSFQIENIMLQRFRNYPPEINGIINEICSRIAGSSGVMYSKQTTKKYLAIIILSYMGVNEEYLSTVMGKEWKPLLFYQLKYSFQSIFVEQNGLISFSHHLFKEELRKNISNELFNEVAKQIVANINTEICSIGFEKHRMCFYLEDFDSWMNIVHNNEKEWGYLASCLNEYCHINLLNGKKYLSIPIIWVNYMKRLSEDGRLSVNDYKNITGHLYSFINEVIETSSISTFDEVINCCRYFLSAFSVFKKNCSNYEVRNSCKDISKYFYERVITCAEKFSLHEKVREFVLNYEKLISSREEETVNNKEDITNNMWQLYDLAKYKEDMDMNRTEVAEAYLQILKLSQKQKILFPNLGHIFEFLLLHADTKYLVEYLKFAIEYIDEISKSKEIFSKDEVDFMIHVYHCNFILEGHLGYLKEKIDELKEYSIKEYSLAKLMYEKSPQEIQYVYDYSMACSDLTIIFTILKDNDKIKYLIETNRKLKQYMYKRFPDTFLYAESYSAFLHNCANYCDIYDENERINFIDDSFDILVPYLNLKNLKASWSYLNHWKIIIDSINDKGKIDNYHSSVFKRVEKNLNYLPDVLRLIFASDGHNITFIKEALARLADIYNLYRFIAKRSTLRILAKSIYDISIQICDIEDSDSSHLFLASTIETLCADQSMVAQEETMDDLQLLKEYELYIEGKITKSPNRVILHEALLVVPQTEIIEMVGMLVGMENMPKEGQQMMRMAWTMLDIDPINIILESSDKAIARMKVIKSLGGKGPMKSREILEMVLSYLLQTHDNYRDKISLLIDSLKKL